METKVLGLSIIFAFIAATMLISFNKWGVFDWYGVHRKKWMPEQVCGFCLGFWISVIFTIIISILSDSNISYIAIPFASASLTLAITKTCVR